MCVFGSTGADGCCNKADDCTPPADSCLMATCVANQCATAPVQDCVPDGGMPEDMATPNPGDLAGLSVGGGGCSLAGDGASSRAPAVLVVAFVLLALSLRRRSA
jgi:MYXO-CTERM domain-containing protein